MILEYLHFLTLNEAHLHALISADLILCWICFIEQTGDLEVRNEINAKSIF